MAALMIFYLAGCTSEDRQNEDNERPNMPAEEKQWEYTPEVRTGDEGKKDTTLEPEHDWEDIDPDSTP